MWKSLKILYTHTISPIPRSYLLTDWKITVRLQSAPSLSTDESSYMARWVLDKNSKNRILSENAVFRPKLLFAGMYIFRNAYFCPKFSSVICYRVFNILNHLKCIRSDNIMILKFLRIEFLFLEQTRFLVLKMVLAWLTIQLSLYNLFDLLKLRKTTLLTPPDMNITQTKTI